MEIIIFIGIPATGKSAFYKNQFYKSHIRLNLDMLKTRHREKLLFHACIEAKQPVVIDNTNVTVLDRKKYIEYALENHFVVKGYYFQSNINECIARNENRIGKEKIPVTALLSAHKKLQLPTLEEGFHELFYVRIDETYGFRIEEYKDEV